MHDACCAAMLELARKRHLSNLTLTALGSNRFCPAVSLPPLQGYDRASGRNASKEETGINSAGVAISDTETIFNSDGALKADPYLNDTGLVEDSLTSVLLPQARSARHGVQLLAKLIASKGNGEGGLGGEYGAAGWLACLPSTVLSKCSMCAAVLLLAGCLPCCLMRAPYLCRALRLWQHLRRFLGGLVP